MAPKSRKNGIWGHFSIFSPFWGHFFPISGRGPFSIFWPIFSHFWISARFPFHTRRPDSQHNTVRDLQISPLEGDTPQVVSSQGPVHGYPGTPIGHLLGNLCRPKGSKRRFPTLRALVHHNAATQNAAMHNASFSQRYPCPFFTASSL